MSYAKFKGALMLACIALALMAVVLGGCGGGGGGPSPGQPAGNKPGVTATVTGRVVNAIDRSAIQGAQVTVVDVVGKAALTDENGRYQITGVPVGIHTFRASAVTFFAASKTVEVQAPSTVVDFELSPLGTTPGEESPPPPPVFD